MTMANISILDANADNGLFARARKALADYRLFRRTLGELDSMTNRELRDLGLSRYSIRQVAHESVYGS